MSKKNIRATGMALAITLTLLKLEDICLGLSLQ